MGALDPATARGVACITLIRYVEDPLAPVFPSIGWDAYTGWDSPIGSKLLHALGGWQKPPADTSAGTFDPQSIRHRRVMNCAQTAQVGRSLA